MDTPSIDYLYKDLPILDYMRENNLEYINLNIYMRFKKDVAGIDILPSSFLYKEVPFTTEKQKDGSYNIFKNKNKATEQSDAPEPRITAARPGNP